MKALSDFTGLYQLSKTLRFELKPMEKTKNRFEEWLSEMAKDEPNEQNLFAKDKAIYEAYKVLKPILDKIHEDFITVSLQSEQAQNIGFEPYYEEYINNKNKSKDEEKDNKYEKNLRKSVGETFKVGAKIINNQDVNNPINLLTDKSILTYIENNITSFTSDTLTEEELKKHLNTFKGFFTYLSGYNTNRENYYTFDKEKSTAVATRIVHVNLPKFCDNILRFEKRKEDYLNVYNYLHEIGKITQIKNSKKREFQETQAISETIFKIVHFNQCLSQPQIEKYNDLIGNYNLLINLYNQSRRQEKEFNKLSEFVTLYKQIGCGKSKSLFVALQKDKESELTDKEKKIDEILTVEKLLHTVADAGNTLFNKPTEIGITTLTTFIEWLKNCEDWKGVYWSRAAVTKISSLYFSNWHDLKDKLKGNKACVSYNKKREEQIKLNDAVELSGLFDVLDKESTEFVFKQSLFDDDDYKDLINKTLLPSKNLINLICADIEKKTKYFLDHSSEITKLEKYKNDKQEEGKEDDIIKQIKAWFDAANDTMRIVRYFSVRTSKMKGNVANAEMENMLSTLLDIDNADWSKWYDSIRNYLTQRPQDGVKDNMLKLNFGKGNLLNGFTDSNTESNNATQYGGYLFRKMNNTCKEYEYYLGISADAHLFRCHLKCRIKDEEKSEFERLEYYQMKSTTPYPSSYEEDKKKIQEMIQYLVNKEIQQDAELIKDAEKINKNTKDRIITPTELIKRLKDSEKSVFNDILKNKILENYINDTIKHIKDNCNQLNRLDKINELLKINHQGYEGLTNLINDLNKITRDNKIFDFFHIRKSELDKAIESTEKPLYLFKISNKDLSYCQTFEDGERKERKDQKENLHTTLFRSLMREFEGCNSIDIGKGEIFYREKAFSYSEDTLKKGHHYEELKDKFSYPIISKKRFANDKYLLYLSIFLNFSSKKYKEPSYGYSEVNNTITDKIQKSQDLQFIGIDRGEKHLVYACTIDKEGKIVKCGHFDDINGTNYVQKLEEKADERTKARKDWQTIGNIRNLKDGYISHVVHKIVDEVIKDEKGTIDPHSYIVLEDLNTEMKRGRQKIEKQVYQKLETALAKKLNFVVDKNSKIDELASVANALQLTPPIANYQDIEGKKQFGVMLYTRANYTSITDPKTGWRKTIYLKDGNENEISTQIMDKFSDFGFDGKDFYFEYTEKNANKTWRLYSGKNGICLPRFRNQKQKKENFDIWAPEAVDVVKILKEVFISLDHTKSFKTQIDEGRQLSKVTGRNETAWQSLRFVIDLIQQIRNSGVKGSTDDNFLYSPIRDEKGNHFDSRNFENNGELSFIKDADANGAYNIARKGLIMDAHINTWIKNGKPKTKKNDNECTDLDLFISDEEWDLWLLDHRKWSEMLPIFASRVAKEDKKKKC